MIRAALCLILAFGLAATAKAAEPLVMATTEFPPYMSESLPEGGVMVALTRAALQQSGQDVSVQFMPWARALEQARAGRIDGLIGAWRSAERESFLIYSDPVLENEVGFFGRKTAVPKYRSLPELKGLKIGTVRGYAYPPAFLAADLNTEEENDDFANLRKLNASRIDLVMIDRSVAEYLIARQLPEARALLQWIEPAILKTPLYTTFPRAAAGAPQNAQALNEGLQKLKRSGAFGMILAKYKISS